MSRRLEPDRADARAETGEDRLAALGGKRAPRLGAS